MKIRKNEDVLVVRLERGEELLAQLHTLIANEHINGAFIHGLGGAERVSLGQYRISDDKEYHFTELEGDLEVCSLNGNIAHDESGKPMIHIHATISDADLRAFGGHVKELIVAGTCELFIDLRTGTLRRSLDQDIGLKLLQLDD